MKITRIIIPVVASTMLLTGCDDQIMQWGKPGDHADVTSADLPLAVKEVIANYDNIKDYASQYTPNMIIGIGMGADLYVNNENGEGDLVNANYQMFTPGNAMKSDAMLGNSGTINFATIDKLIAAMPEGMKLYGHNFFWHTQQNQSYSNRSSLLHSWWKAAATSKPSSRMVTSRKATRAVGVLGEIIVLQKLAQKLPKKEAMVSNLSILRMALTTM